MLHCDGATDVKGTLADAIRGRDTIMLLVIQRQPQSC